MMLMPKTIKRRRVSRGKKISILKIRQCSECKWSHIHKLIARSGGYSGLAEEYKLDRMDSQGKLVRWNR